MKKLNSFLFLLIAVLLTNTTLICAQQTGASDFYNRGIEQQQQGNYYEALEYLQQALQLNPTYADALFHLAECSYYLDEYDLTLQYANEALKYSKNNADIQNLQGMAYIALGNLEQARLIFTDVLNRYPNNVESRFGLAELDLFVGRLGDAETLYKDALKRQGTNRKALLSLALVSSEQGKNELAQKYIDQALQYHSGNAEVHFLSAYLAAQNGDYSQAEYRVRSAVQINNDYDAAYELLAEILFAQEKYLEVADICDFCINRNRSNADIWYLKGLTFFKQQKFTDALNAWEVGLSLNPQDEIMRAALELLVQNQIPLEDSRRSQWASYHISKASAWERDFNSSAMRFEYQRALKLNPFDSTARTSYANQLVRDGMNELYLEQLKFIKIGNENNGVTPSVQLTDTIEAYESLLNNTLGTKWNVNPLSLDKIRWHLGVYYQPSSVQLRHAEAERVTSELLCDIFSGVSAASIDVNAMPVSSYTEAFRNARNAKIDYFIILSLDETSRELTLNATMYSAVTGNKIQTFSLFRTGNDRLAISLRLLRRKILEVLPIRGKVIARDGKTLLVDLGKSEGVVLGSEFDVVKNGEVYTRDSESGVNYQSNSILGTATVTTVGEEISETSFVQKGFFDRLNIGDEVILTKIPETTTETTSEVATETAPAANASGQVVTNSEQNNSASEENALTAESLGLVRMPALIELIRNIRSSN